MTAPAKIRVYVVIDDGTNRYYLLKVERSGFDVYCIPPHLGIHFSLHESGEAYIRPERKAAKPRKEPPVLLMHGEAGMLIDKGIIRAPLCDIGVGSGICTAAFPIDSLTVDFEKFDRTPAECFVIDRDLIPGATSWVEIGVWAVPERNKVSFDQNIPNIPDALLYKVVQCEPQIWIYARPFV